MNAVTAPAPGPLELLDNEVEILQHAEKRAADDLEIHYPAVIDPVDDGYWVKAWVYVPKHELKDQPEFDLDPSD